MKISFIKNHDNLTIDFMYVAQNGPFDTTQQPSSTPKTNIKSNLVPLDPYFLYQWKGLFNLPGLLPSKISLP